MPSGLVRSMSESPPEATCACGHPRRFHFGGDGPCMAAHRNKDGKLADATVCPCSALDLKEAS